MSASAEVAIKRRMLIEKAYEGRPEAPVWTGSEHFLGFRDSENGRVIDPEVVRYQASKLKEESQSLREQRLKREEDAEMAKAAHGAARK